MTTKRERLAQLRKSKQNARAALKASGGRTVSLDLTRETAAKLETLAAGRSKAATLTDLINRAEAPNSAPAG